MTARLIHIINFRWEMSTLGEWIDFCGIYLYNSGFRWNLLDFLCAQRPDDKVEGYGQRSRLEWFDLP